MGNVSLLNEKIDFELASAMIAAVESATTEQARRLTNTLLDREQYLKTFGAHQELEKILYKLRDAYNRATKR